MFRRCNFIPINGTVCYAPHTCFPMFELITLDREYGSQDDDKEKCVAKFRKEKEKLLGQKRSQDLYLFSNKLAHNTLPVRRGSRSIVSAEQKEKKEECEKHSMS